MDNNVLLLRKIKMSAVSQRPAARVQSAADVSEGTGQEETASVVCGLCPTLPTLLVHCAAASRAGDASEQVSLLEDTHVVRARAFPIHPALRVVLGTWVVPSRSGRRSKVSRMFAIVASRSCQPYMPQRVSYVLCVWYYFITVIPYGERAIYVHSRRNLYLCLPNTIIYN